MPSFHALSQKYQLPIYRTGNWTTISTVGIIGSGAYITPINTLVPADATGLLIHRVKGGRTLDVRPLGAPDYITLYAPDALNGESYGFVACDSLKRFEARYQFLSGGALAPVYLIGYTTPSVTYISPGVNITPPVSGSWQTVDLSTLCPDAIGILIEATYSPGSRGGVRKHGSTDDRTESLASTLVVTGCDENQIIDICNYLDFPPFATFILRGYITDGATFQTNADDISLGAPFGVYQDIDIGALIANPQMAFIEVVNPITSGTRFSLKGRGVTDLPNQATSRLHQHQWAWTETDLAGIISGLGEDANVDFYLIGASRKILPAVTTVSAQDIKYNSARLVGNLIRDGDAGGTKIGFEWGTVSGVYTHSLRVGSVNQDNYLYTATPSLDAGTTYYFRAWATNSEGTTYGAEISFTTYLAPCVITLLSAIDITEHQATLRAYMVDDGGQVCSVKFEYGATTSYGSVTGAQDARSGDTVSVTIRELSEGKAYHFRAVGVNQMGIVHTQDFTFSTLSNIGPMLLMTADQYASLEGL